MAVVRWKLTDVNRTGPEPFTYTFDINPNEGGSPQVSKHMHVMTNVGPNRGGILQEGQSQVPKLSFGGVILDQAHYEALEAWYDRRVLLELTDDLGRGFLGVLTAFSPQRERRPYNPWFHRYTAEFTVWRYTSASGQRIY